MTDIPAEVRTALDGLRALGGDNLLRQMAAVFVQHSGDRVKALESAAADGDFVAAAAAAHALKGSARQLGMTVMGDACLAAEQAAKAGDAAGLQLKAAAVHASYMTAADWLAQLTA